MQFENPGSYPNATIIQGSEIYSGVEPVKVAADEQRAAAALFRQLPLDTVPEPGALPAHLAGSYLERYRFDPEGAPSAYLAELRRPESAEPYLAGLRGGVTDRA